MFLTVAIFSISCTIPMRVITTGPQNAASVPKDFDPKRNILLVMAIARLDNASLVDMKSTINLDAEMQKQYPYQYRLVTQKELEEAADMFTDTSIYRFVLTNVRWLVVQRGSFQLDVEEGLAFVPGYKATYIDFAFYDRVTRQRFPYSGTSTSVMKLAVSNLTKSIDKAMEQKAVEKLKESSALNKTYEKTGLSLAE